MLAKTTTSHCGICSKCGCTWESACHSKEYGNCWWIDETETLCSHCFNGWGTYKTYKSNNDFIKKIASKVEVIIDETGDYKELAERFDWEVTEVDGKPAYRIRKEV